jgi:plastocyanin
VLEPTVNLTGRIELVGGDALIEETIIYFIPEQAGSTSATEPDQTFEIATLDKALSPTVMAVPRGARVSFPNNDPILHNLFSVSPDNGFDLGVYGPGEAPSVTFEQTGVVNIYCNVHHDMHAHVLVIDSPWRTRAASDGGFLIEGLPTGPGELHVWHRQSERWSQAVELPLSGPLQISLEVTKPLLPAHRDKTGQPYNRRGRDPYR